MHACHAILVPPAREQYLAGWLFALPTTILLTFSPEYQSRLLWHLEYQGNPDFS